MDEDQLKDLLDDSSFFSVIEEQYTWFNAHEMSAKDEDIIFTNKVIILHAASSIYMTIYEHFLYEANPRPVSAVCIDGCFTLAGAQEV